MVSEPRWKTRAFAMKLSWGNFLVGALCGAIVMAAGAGTWVWWWRSTHVGEISYEEAARGLSRAISYEQGILVKDLQTYDMCLADGKTTVACDALMRVLARLRAEKAVIKQQVDKRLAEGFTKCEVVKWGYENGFVASQMSEAVGIPLQDARKC